MTDPARYVERACERYIRRARVTALTPEAWHLWLLSGLWPLLWKAKRAAIVSEQHAGSDLVWNMVDGRHLVVHGRWTGHMRRQRAMAVRQLVGLTGEIH